MGRPNSTIDPDDDFSPVIGGASGLVIRNGKVLLICRGMEPFKGYWSLPSGGVDRGERLREAVKREVFEETGLEVEVGMIAGYREEVFPNHYVIPAFYCTVTGGELRAGDDAAAAEFVDPREALARRIVPALEDVFRDAGLLD